MDKAETAIFLLVAFTAVQIVYLFNRHHEGRRMVFVGVMAGLGIYGLMQMGLMLLDRWGR